MIDRIQLRCVLPSVYGKEGFEELVTVLRVVKVELVSMGFATTRIATAGIPVTPIEQLARFPECLDGRVKTFHPRTHAGILADRRLPTHVSRPGELGVAPLDLMAVDLCPSKATVASGTGTGECVEQIDIGGPLMVHATTKNHSSIAVITSTSQYPIVLAAFARGRFTLRQRHDLAIEVFRHTASYDITVVPWMGATITALIGDGPPAWLGVAWVRKQDLRYGENSHQAAALYTCPSRLEGIAQVELLYGKPTSYNNYTDGETAYRAASDFAEPCVAIIKYTNPCGIAVGSDIVKACHRAHACDPVSTFGGMIAANRPVTAELAEQIKDIFTEVMIASGFDPEALVILTTKKNLRLLKAVPHTHRERVLHPVSGGALLQ